MLPGPTIEKKWRRTLSHWLLTRYLQSSGRSSADIYTLFWWLTLAPASRSTWTTFAWPLSDAIPKGVPSVPCNGTPLSCVQRVRFEWVIINHILLLSPLLLHTLPMPLLQLHGHSGRQNAVLWTPSETKSRVQILAYHTVCEKLRFHHSMLQNSAFDPIQSF